jgi:hypothetical protein
MRILLSLGYPLIEFVAARFCVRVADDHSDLALGVNLNTRDRQPGVERGSDCAHDSGPLELAWTAPHGIALCAGRRIELPAEQLASDAAGEVH